MADDPHAAPPSIPLRCPAGRRVEEETTEVDAVVIPTGMTPTGMTPINAVPIDSMDHPVVGYSAMPAPLSGAPDVARVLLIGGAQGAAQVIDIFSQVPGQQAVAILDDDPNRWGAEIAGVPIIGGTDRLVALFAEGAFDAAIIAIGRSVATRARFRQLCAQAGIPLANAVDPTSKIATDVVIGQGNIICAFCHLGTGVRVGDNNFLSAYNSFDHHSVIGSDNATGPGCTSSGRVTVGDRVRFGTGIFIEPNVRIGDDVMVASGSVLLLSVPANHVVKTKVITTTVVPRRR